MRPKLLAIILMFLAFVAPASPAHAGGIVSVCDEAHLLAALAGGGTVTFSCSGRITLTAQITIAADTTIDGSEHTITISGNNAVRAFAVNSGVLLNLYTVSVADGNVIGDQGGGIYNNGTLFVSNSSFSGNETTYGSGGAIANINHGTVVVNNCVFADNTASDSGSIYNDLNSTMTVNNSTFSNNSAADFSGGGITNYGAMTVSNSTFFANSAYWSGGAISNYGTMTVSNSTFSRNQTHYVVCGTINNQYLSTAVLENSIIANGLIGNNCCGAITDGGGNLSYPDTTCPGINADPLLGPLQNNGGPTETMDLGPGSAAFEAANAATCAASPVNNLDQRGVTRPQGARCDIGAVEHSLPFRKWLPAVRAR